MHQIAILAGGLATRLMPITETIPKSMVLVAGRPFLEYQLRLLSHHGVKDVVLCVGHLSERIERHFGDGAHLGVRIRYSREPDSLLGTAGALRHAKPLLQDQFFVMYGDSYLMYEYAAVMKAAADAPALMVVYRNDGRYDVSNAAVEGDWVTRYEKNGGAGDLRYIDAGLLVFQRDVLDIIPEGAYASLDRDVLPDLVRDRRLKAYPVQQRFFEVGSPVGLEEFRRLVGAGAIPGLPAVLDRNPLHGPTE